MLAVAYQMEAHDVRELVELFQGLDLNGDGLLTSAEFKKAVQTCGVEDTWIDRMMASRNFSLPPWVRTSTSRTTRPSSAPSEASIRTTAEASPARRSRRRCA